MFLGTDTGLNPQPAIYPCTGTVNGMLLADMDGDGQADLLVEGAGGRLDIYRGNGDGTFATVSEIGSGASSGLTGHGGRPVGVADLNGDGILDIVTGTAAGINVLVGQKGLNYQLQGTVYAGPGGSSYVFADLNDDGRLDVAVGAPTGVNALYAADGTMQASGTVVASQEPSVYAQPITLTATLKGGSDQPTPGGSVVFSLDGVQVGTATLDSGAGSYTITADTIAADLNNPIYWVGAHALTAAYSGDGNYAAATLKGSHTVIGQPTVSEITQLATTIYYGQEIGYDNGIDAVTNASPADPASAVGSLSGVLTVYLDGGVVCQTVYGETARCPDAPFQNANAGQHPLLLTYSGDQRFAASTSPTYVVTVLPDPTATNLTSSLNPSTAGQAVTFTATVEDAYATAAGTVNFLDGQAVIGTGTLNGQGVATFTTSTLAVGTHNMTACLVASLNFNASCSPVLPQVVNPAGGGGTQFTLTVTPTPISVGVGNFVTLTVTVTPLDGFSQPVQLGCGGLPKETTCTFAQSLIPAGGGTTSLIVSPAAPHPCGSSVPDFIAPNGPGGDAPVPVLVLGGLGLLFARRRRRLLRSLALAALLCVLPLLGGGCGNKCLDFGTEPTNYTFTLNGSSTGSPVVSQTIPIKMKVHL